LEWSHVFVLGIIEYVSSEPEQPVINTCFTVQMFSPETCHRCGFPRRNCVLWHSQSCYTEHV